MQDYTKMLLDSAEIISAKVVKTKGNLTQLIASTCDEN